MLINVAYDQVSNPEINWEVKGALSKKIFLKLQKPAVFLSYVIMTVHFAGFLVKTYIIVDKSAVILKKKPNH